MIDPNSPDGWRMALIRGFPWEDSDHQDDNQRRCESAEAAGLLELEETEPDSMEREEHGDTVWRLTDLGKVLYQDAHAPDLSKTTQKPDGSVGHGGIAVFGGAGNVAVASTVPAYEFLPGDGPTPVTEAWDILDRITTRSVGSAMNYEGLCKVRVIFRKLLEDKGWKRPIT